MATGLDQAAQPATTGTTELQELAKKHLWMHFTKMGAYSDHELPVIVKGDGCYVWDEHGEVLGCLQLTVIPGMSQKGAWHAQIEGVRTLGSRRGSGIGKKMMAAIMEIARKKGCKSMQLLTNKSRVAAQRFYRSLGFENSHEGMKAKL